MQGLIFLIYICRALYYSFEREAQKWEEGRGGAKQGIGICSTRFLPRMEWLRGEVTITLLYRVAIGNKLLYVGTR